MRKKSSLFFLMGPPKSAPNWLRIRGDWGRGLTLKKLRASKKLFRRYSNIWPWNAFVPERVAMVTMDPEFRPYSAGKFELSTLNSETVSIEGWKVIWFCTSSLRLMPLTIQLVVFSRWPAVLIPREPKPCNGKVRKPFCGGVTVPGERRAK